MPKSTPLNQIRKEQDNSELVQNILNDMEHDQPTSMPPSQMQQPRGAPMQQQQHRYEDEDEYEEFYDDIVEEKPKNSTDIMIAEMKLPLLVAFLVFLTNFQAVNDMIVKNIPKLAVGDELNMMGLIVKALAAGLIFYLVRRFLL